MANIYADSRIIPELLKRNLQANFKSTTIAISFNMIENIDYAAKNSSFYAFQFRINILLKIFPILFIFTSLDSGKNILVLYPTFA